MIPPAGSTPRSRRKQPSASVFDGIKSAPLSRLPRDARQLDKELIGRNEPCPCGSGQEMLRAQLSRPAILTAAQSHMGAMLLVAILRDARRWRA
ncbi:MAG: SEC-C domain-containing protein, partial [Sphingopyxis sp.]|nr:SEC-C domain-containing protein [Sphingopyxis sp.]